VTLTVYKARQFGKVTNYAFKKYGVAPSVTDAILRDSAALSVIGRSANSTGDPADIATMIADRVCDVLKYQPKSLEHVRETVAAVVAEFIKVQP
jgi:hypothetical protein